MIEADRAAAGGSLTERLGRGGLPPFYLRELTERDAQEWLDGYWAKDIQELFRLERRSGRGEPHDDRELPVRLGSCRAASFPSEPVSD